MQKKKRMILVLLIQIFVRHLHLHLHPLQGLRHKWRTWLYLTKFKIVKKDVKKIVWDRSPVAVQLSCSAGRCATISSIHPCHWVVGGSCPFTAQRSYLLRLTWFDHTFFTSCLFFDLISFRRGGAYHWVTSPHARFSQRSISKKNFKILFSRFGTGGLRKSKKLPILVKKRKHIHCTSRTNSSLTVFSWKDALSEGRHTLLTARNNIKKIYLRKRGSSFPSFIF